LRINREDDCPGCSPNKRALKNIAYILGKCRSLYASWWTGKLAVTWLIL
jgi:hypothetical protein